MSYWFVNIIQNIAYFGIFRQFLLQTNILSSSAVEFHFRLFGFKNSWSSKSSISCVLLVIEEGTKKKKWVILRVTTRWLTRTTRGKFFSIILPLAMQGLLGPGLLFFTNPPFQSQSPKFSSCDHLTFNTTFQISQSFWWIEVTISRKAVEIVKKTSKSSAGFWRWWWASRFRRSWGWRGLWV